jgi:hypothetical protein
MIERDRLVLGVRPEFRARPGIRLQPGADLDVEVLRDPDGFLVDLAIVLIVVCQALRIDRPAEIRKKQRPIALVAPITFILLKLERELIKDRRNAS